MKNKGFTLIEVIVCVCILGLIGLLVVPNILEVVDKKDKEILETRKSIIYAQVNNYMNQHKEEYPIKSGNVYCFQLKTLLNEKIIDISLDKIDDKKYVKVSIDNNEDYIYDIKTDCTDIK